MPVGEVVMKWRGTPGEVVHQFDQPLREVASLIRCSTVECLITDHLWINSVYTL